MDFERLVTENNPFRGFFTLFWVTMASGTLHVIYKHWRTYGTFISLKLALQMSKNAEQLLLADVIMVASLFVTVLFQKLFSLGWLSQLTCLIIQHVWQIIWFTFFIGLIFVVDWDWVL